MTNETEWHNTGGNGQARETWVRKVGVKVAIVSVMPYRSIVEVYENGRESEESGRPFETLAEGKAYADRFLGAP